MSLAMAEQFNLSLKGDVPPDQAVHNLQEELTKIVEQRLSLTLRTGGF
jgi:multiple sugar transport system substrate-binding protein